MVVDQEYYANNPNASVILYPEGIHVAKLSNQHIALVDLEDSFLFPQENRHIEMQTL